MRLLTLHRAKGLEFDVVFLPGLTKGHLPHPGKGGNNPSERWQRLPFELRGDRDFLPDPPTTKEQLDQLRDEEERRLMYVGVTRGRRRLVLSRAWYYRDNAGPKEPSPFWEEAVASELVAPREAPCPPENRSRSASSSRRSRSGASSRHHRTMRRSRGSSPSSSFCARSRRSARRRSWSGCRRRSR